MYKLFKRTYYPGHFEVQLAGACDPGLSREHNEDAITIQEDDGRGYYMAIVCDGMGGHNAGELASAMAVERIRAYLDTNFRKQGPRELLYHGFLLASTALIVRPPPRLPSAASGAGRSPARRAGAAAAALRS